MAKHAKHAKPAVHKNAAEALAVVDKTEEVQAPAPTPFNLDSQIKQERRRRRRGKVILGVFLALIVGVYAGGCVLFSQMFYPKTYFAGNDISLKTNDQVAALIEEIEVKYQVNVTGQGIELSMPGKEAGVSIDGDAVVAAIHEDDTVWRWPLKLFVERDYSDYLRASVEGSALADALEAAVAEVNATATPPTNATVGYDSSKKGFVVVPEVPGTQLELDAVVNEAIAGAAAFEPSIELSENVLTLPPVLQNDPTLPEAAEAANALLTAEVALKMGGITVASLGHDEIASWVTFDEALVPSVNAELKDQWVAARIDELTTVGEKRTYKHDDKEVEVEGGDYGWDVDEDAFTQLVETILTEGQTGNVDIPLEREAVTWLGAGQPDWGNRYIDIDLSKQHAWMYNASGELIWESDIVSGSPATPTPTGVFYIKSVNGATTLKGTNLDGTKYESKVRYWMPFRSHTHGLHDADWQWAFGGTRYKDGVGSHGCVNLPVDKAKELHSLVEKGDPVVVHW